MQKLFSMFPSGAPGVALLMLRLTVTAEFLFDLFALRWAVTMPSILWIGVGVLALALCSGVATPLLSALAAVFQLVKLAIANGTDVPLHATHLSTAFALVLLGPGGYSIDAKLFGRRVMVIQSRSS